MATIEVPISKDVWTEVATPISSGFIQSKGFAVLIREDVSLPSALSLFGHSIPVVGLFYNLSATNNLYARSVYPNTSVIITEDE